MTGWGWISSLLALAVFPCGAALAQTTRADSPSASPLVDRIVPLEATVNGTSQGVWTFAERQGQLYVGKDAFEEWRVAIPMSSQPITVRGQEYWPLRDLPGFTLKVNYASQTAEITFAGEAFLQTKLSRELSIPKPSPVLPSVFVNYDLNLQTTRTQGFKVQNDLGALVELGGSNEWGVWTSTHVGRSLTDPGLSRWTRLETTFTRHMPDKALSLRIGDASTRQGLWGSSVYFGGVQIGSNYNLTPGFLTQPLPLVGGVSAAPSTVQLYINDVLRQVSQVPAGPFVIDNLTGVSGAGEARVVVRDILGREVVYVQHFFTSGQLLAQGLSDWSAEVGALRESLGSENADYGSRFATGTWRHGWNNLLTVEGRGELTRRSRTAGVGMIAGLPYDVLGRAAVVASDYSGFGQGAKWMLAAERRWSATALYLQAQGATRKYTELGRAPSSAFAPTRLEWAMNIGTVLPGQWGRLGFNLVGAQRYGARNVTTASLNYTAVFPSKSTLSVTLSKAFGAPAGGTLLGVSLAVPLGEALQAQATATRHGGATDFYLSASQSSLGEDDFGWRVLAGKVQAERHAEAGIYYGGRYGRVFADLSSAASQTSLRSGAAGGLVFAAGRPFVTKRVDQSFGVVEVKGLRDIGVGLGSAITARTDENGIAFVPYLSPYQQNHVRLNASDVPMSAEITSLEKQVVPMWRSAVKIDFPVRSGRAALIKLVFDDGDPAAAGGIVQIEGDAEEFYVARRGEVYVTGLEADSRLVLRYKEQSCKFAVPLPPAAADDVVRVGPVLCSGVKR